MLLRKIIAIFLSVGVVITPPTPTSMGDIFYDTRFNALDMAVFRRYFLGTYQDVTHSAADMNLDGEINIQDLVRMKKYQAGELLHNYSINTGVNWLVLRDTDSSAFPVVVGYRLDINCYTKTVCLPGRYTSEISGFVCAEKNPNPEFELPDLVVSTISINDEIIPIKDTISLVSPTWIYDCKSSTSQISVPTLSTYNCLIIAMMKEAIVPYQQKEIEFEF